MALPNSTAIYCRRDHLRGAMIFSNMERFRARTSQAIGHFRRYNREPQNRSGRDIAKNFHRPEVDPDRPNSLKNGGFMRNFSVCTKTHSSYAIFAEVI